MSRRSTKTKRVTEVYEQIRDLIVSGQLAPGSRIIESDLVERLDVSRTPIRSALQRLRYEGYVATISEGERLRQAVAPLTKSDAKELFYIIGQIEGMAAFFTAALDEDRRAEVAEAMADVNQSYSESVDVTEPDFKHLFDLDTRFHRICVEAGAGPRLLDLHDSMKPQADRYNRVYVRMLTSQIPISIREHEQIVAAIEAGDRDRAERAMQTNWRNATERLNQVIEVMGERGSW